MQEFTYDALPARIVFGPGSSRTRLADEAARSEAVCEHVSVETAEAARGLRALANELGPPRGLRELGMAEDRIDEIATLTEPVVPADNPVPVGGGALRGLVRTAWAGEAA